MKLLQSEVNLIPGEDPNYAYAPEGYVGQGVAILELHNTTGYQNAYKVRLECQDPFWKPAWAQVVPLEPERGDGNAPPTGYPDQLGPKNQWASVYVTDGGTRKIMIALRAPRTSEARAGVYRFNVIIESRIEDPQSPMSEIKELPLTAIVRPFFDLHAEWSPDSARVGLIRRKRPFELVITSAGNDWAYVQAAVGNKAEMIVDRDQEVIAIPPPAPGQKVSRAINFIARTKMKKLRAANTATDLPVTLRQVDAPGVPALVGPPQQTQNANLGAAVLSSVENPIEVAEKAKLVYCPLIPATFEQFLQSIVRNAKSIAFFIIGTVIMVTLTFAGYQRLVQAQAALSVSPSAENGTVIVKKDLKTGRYILTLNGSGLKGATVTMLSEDKKEEIGDALVPIELPKDKKGKKVDNPRRVKGATTWFNPLDDRYTAQYDLTNAIKSSGKTNPIFGGVVVRSNFLFGDLGGLLKRVTPDKVSIGVPQVQAQELNLKARKQVVVPGDKVTIDAQGETNFGGKGKVFCDEVPVNVLSWKEKVIVIQLPDEISDAPVIVVEAAGGNDKGSLTLQKKVDPNAVAEGGTPYEPTPDEGAPAGGPGPGGTYPGAEESDPGTQPTENPGSDNPPGAGATDIGNSGTLIEPDVYQGLIKALAGGRSELSSFAANAGAPKSKIGKICVAFAVAASGNPDRAEAALNKMGPAETDLGKMFMLVARAEVNIRNRNREAGLAQLSEALEIAGTLPAGAQGAAFAAISSARVTDNARRKESSIRQAKSKAVFDEERALLDKL